MSHKFIILLLLSSTLFSCQKIWLDDNPENSHSAIYEALWSEIDDNYVFFDLKNIDWLEVHDRYEAQISPEMTDEALFSVLSLMLTELKDGHVSLYAGFNQWLYYDFYLKDESNFNKSFVEKTYLKQPNQIGPFFYTQLPENIGYIYYESFGENFTNQDLAYLLDHFKDTKGLIIDVRGNTGGAADNVTQFVSAFIDQDMEIGKAYSSSKRGSGLDQVEIINIASGELGSLYSKPIVLLTNRKCYSSCNLFAGFMSTLPNVTIVGDTTGGGSGLSVGSELANGWRFRYSAAKLTLIDDTEIELGIAPDLVISTGPVEEIEGKDAIIDKAIELLK